MKDFGTSQSPKSTRQRDSRYCPDRPARAQLRHDDHNDSTACRMRYLYALRHSLSAVTAAIQPRLRLSGTNRLRFALHGG
ncbi:MAG: hypothetical protein G8D28_08385 [gamma proteobacterium symbiont of Phacoides pectinatus]